MKYFLQQFGPSVSRRSESQEDDEAVRQLPQAFCEASAKQDGHELAKIMADDVDFVTVATTYLPSRADFQKNFTCVCLASALRTQQADNGKFPTTESGRCSLELENCGRQEHRSSTAVCRDGDGQGETSGHLARHRRTKYQRDSGRAA